MLLLLLLVCVAAAAACACELYEAGKGDVQNITSHDYAVHCAPYDKTTYVAP
jgi:hypothetical protein